MPGLLDSVTKAARRLPTRLVLYATEKWGKTSFAAFAPRPLFLMTRGETGLLTLLQSGQLPPTDHLPRAAACWDDVANIVRALTRDPHDFGTLVIDTANGAHQLCAEAVCQGDFENSWAGFNSYAKGWDVVLPKWVALLDALDTLRERRGMAVILLCHARVRNFKSPTGGDFDRYEPDMDKKVWGATHKWADVIGFGSLVIGERQTGDKNRVKALGGQQRVLHFGKAAAYDAGNRYGLPATLQCGNSPRAAWEAFAKALAAALKNGPAAEGEPGQPAAEAAAAPSTDAAGGGAADDGGEPGPGDTTE